MCLGLSLTFFFVRGGRSSYLHLVAGVFPEPGSQSGGDSRSKDGGAELQLRGMPKKT